MKIAPNWTWNQVDETPNMVSVSTFCKWCQNYAICDIDNGIGRLKPHLDRKEHASDVETACFQAHLLRVGALPGQNWAAFHNWKQKASPRFKEFEAVNESLNPA